MTGKKTTVIAVSVPTNIAEQLKPEAAKAGSSVSKMVSAYIRAGLGKRIINGEVES